MRYLSAPAVLALSVLAGVAGCNASETADVRPRGDAVAGVHADTPATATNNEPPVVVAGERSKTASVGVAAAGAGAENVIPPVVAGQVRRAELPPITVHLAGDSTVSDYPATTVQEGWGQELGQFFNDRVTIDNKAIGGANVQSFRSGNWGKIIAVLKPGDYVLFQFGANDSGTAHGPVSPADFAKTLREMADEVKAKKATPIFVTPSAFYQWSGGKADNARLAPYAAAMVTASQGNVVVADLNARGVEFLNSAGQTAATPLYMPSRGTVDKAHFVKAGATKMAQLVSEELKRTGSPLAEYLK